MSNLRRDAHWLLGSESQFISIGNCVSLRFVNELHRDSPACIATDVTAPVEACRPHFANRLIIGDVALAVSLPREYRHQQASMLLSSRPSLPARQNDPASHTDPTRSRERSSPR